MKQKIEKNALLKVTEVLVAKMNINLSFLSL